MFGQQIAARRRRPVEMLGRRAAVTTMRWAGRAAALRCDATRANVSKHDPQTVSGSVVDDKIKCPRNPDCRVKSFVGCEGCVT